MLSSSSIASSSVAHPPSVAHPNNNKENSGNNSNNKPKSNRSAGYTVTEDILVCRSFIAASEDPIVGTNQSGGVFQEKMLSFYSDLINDQQNHNLRQMQTASAVVKSTMINVKLKFPVRNAKSIYDRFKSTIAPAVCKFIGIVEATPIDSGRTEEDHLRSCMELYQERQGKSFSNFLDCYHYLKDKAKFHSFSDAVKKAEDAKKRPKGNKAAKNHQKDVLDAKSLMKELVGESSPVPSVVP